MKIEICSNSYESAINAKKAGADRIELCSELAIGGITPSYGLIKKVIEDIAIKVNILIRPRSGNFAYSDTEFDIMKKNILFCKEQGCNGIVSGILTNDLEVDFARTKQLIELANPLPFTFHRAFDLVTNPLDVLEDLISLGVRRVLTSGQEIAAISGIKMLKRLHLKSNGRIIILPGGGIDKNNIVKFKISNFKEVHFSATKYYKEGNSAKVPLNSNQFFDDTQIAISNFDIMKEMIDLVK